MAKKNSQNNKIITFSFNDWKLPCICSVIAVFVVILCWWIVKIDEAQLLSVVDGFIGLVFSYAATMMGLLVTAFTILQTVDNEQVKRIKTHAVYTRYKKNLYKILWILAVLAISCGITQFLKYSWAPLGIMVFGLWTLVGVVFTLVATITWVKILIDFLSS